jgi:hypothetical protein
MRVFLPKGRIPLLSARSPREAAPELAKVINATKLPLYDGVAALKDAGLARVDENRRRR